MHIKMVRHLSFYSLLFIVLLVGCDDYQKKIEPSGKVVKIGFVGPLTGQNGVMGRNSLYGVKAALQFRPFLLNGDMVDIVALDDQDDPQLSDAAIKKLIKKENVSAILLGSSSKTVLSVVDRLDESTVPGIALLATHPDITKGEYITQLPSDDVQQGTVAALFVLDEMKVDRVALFFEPQEVHSVLLSETFTKKIIQAGGTVEIIKYPQRTTELQDILEGLRESGINFLYLPVQGAAVVEIENICRTMDYDPKVMLSDGVLSRIILDHNNDFSLVEGMMTVDVYTSDKITKGYGEKMRKAFDGPFSATQMTPTALGAEGMSILLSAMDRCENSGDRQCIGRNIRSTNNFLGVNSTISITPEGKAERPIFINTIVEGRLEFQVMVY